MRQLPSVVVVLRTPAALEIVALEVCSVKGRFDRLLCGS